MTRLAGWLAGRITSSIFLPNSFCTERSAVCESKKRENCRNFCGSAESFSSWTSAGYSVCCWKFPGVAGGCKIEHRCARAKSARLRRSWSRDTWPGNRTLDALMFPRASVVGTAARSLGQVHHRWVVGRMIVSRKVRSRLQCGPSRPLAHAAAAKGSTGRGSSAEWACPQSGGQRPSRTIPLVGALFFTACLATVVVVVIRGAWNLLFWFGRQIILCSTSCRSIAYRTYLIINAPSRAISGRIRRPQNVSTKKANQGIKLHHGPPPFFNVRASRRQWNPGQG